MCLKLLIALISGMGLTLAFAPYEIFPIALFALAVLIWLWQYQSPKSAFVIGFIFGVGFFGAGVYWVYISIHSFGDVPIPLSILITAGLVAILSFYPAFTGFLANRYFPAETPAKTILVIPALWMLTEWARSLLLSGFPWLLVGYSQTNSPLKGYAPIFSVYGVSLAVAISAALLVQGIRTLKEKNYFSVYLSLFAIVAIWSMGTLLNLIPYTETTHKPLTLSLVQGNIPQTLKWSPEHLQLSFDRYTELTKPLWGKSQIIIWPEAAIPVPLLEADDFIEAMDQQALKNHSQLILGIPIKSKTRDKYFNAVITLGAQKEVYVKRHLVPFGEYTPFSEVFSGLLQFMDIPMSDLIPGKSQQPPLFVAGVKILTAICYEIAFPQLMNTSDPTIGLILTVTNDAWFGKSNAQAQHLQMAQMRAIELRRPSLLISNDGITAIITSEGNIEAQVPPYEIAVLTGKIFPTFGLTPWMVMGMDPILILVMIMLYLGVRLSPRNEIISNQTLVLSKLKE